jgi:hypothetical protein
MPPSWGRLASHGIDYAEFRIILSIDDSGEWTMITVTFYFPHYVSRQTELRLIRFYTGRPVTATVPLPHHVSQQTEWQSIRVHPGSPVTATVALTHSPTCAELRSTFAHAGSPATTTVVFPRPSIRTELRSAQTHAGSPVTEILALSRPSVLAELRSIHTQAGSPVTAKIIFPKLPTQTVSLKWNTDRKIYTTAVINFRNDYHNLATASIGYCYDWKTVIQTALRYRHWSLVPPGWKIVAKNIERGESFDLGFIEVDNPVLENVFLPDGDYEISVLTSSLFWKDCLDRTVRTISIRPGEEVTPLPTIYNLRSAVLNGVTTIRWSANQSGLGDCVFGIWYSSDSPVDVMRTPDTTVWYYPSQTEYVTTFRQNAPAFVAVAAIRTGDESETGKVHELFLDWNDVPPRRPDDVILWDKPLPAIDNTVEKRREDDPFGAMWGG